MSLDLSCPDWEQRIREGRSPIRDELLRPTPPGDRAVKVFDKLRLSDVVGTPTNDEACGDWFRDIVRVLYSWWDPETKARLVREVFTLVAKKNSKTSYGALLMLTALLLNKRPRAPFVMTGPVQDVAHRAFDAAAGAIGLDPVLEKKLHVRDHLKTIIHRETKAELQIMTFDPAVLTGQKLVGALIDELHVVAKMAKAPSSIRQLRGGMMPFPEAFMVFITSQSEDEPVGVFKSELARARDIRNGKAFGRMLPVLYEFPKAIHEDRGQWSLPENWPMVNPNLNRSVRLETLVEAYAEAESKGEAELLAWASQHLTIEIGTSVKADSWVGATWWDKRCRPVSLEEILERCEVVTAGVDGGGLEDLLGLCILGRVGETGEWLGWMHAWVHRQVLERRKQIAEKLLDLSKAGELTIVDEIGPDVLEAVAIIKRVNEAGLLDKVGLDPHGVGEILTELMAAGIAHEEGASTQVVGVSQGWKLTSAIKTAERMLAKPGGLVPDSSGLGRWCVGNARVEMKGNAIVITKQASGSAKIDPLMAMFNAIHLMTMNPEAKGRSFWEGASANARSSEASA